jgi:hypothetical protein
MCIAFGHECGDGYLLTVASGNLYACPGEFYEQGKITSWVVVNSPWLRNAHSSFHMELD